MASTETGPTQLEQSFKDMLATHRLNTMTVTYIDTPDPGAPFFVVTVQRWTTTPHSVGHAHAATIGEALSKAISELAPQAALADEPLPESAQ